MRSCEPFASSHYHRTVHVPDGFINAPTSAVAGVVAAGAIAVSLRGARRELDERTAPLAGLVAAFIFAVQMLNFPVLPGVSGHLLGGALAAILVGPWVGALCVSVVLIVQALIFADGGLTAIGLNITNMALLATATGYLVAVLMLRVLPRTTLGLGVTTFVASVVSVVLAALGFLGQYWLGGSVNLELSLAQAAGVMGGVHVLIGVGEGLIAATTVMTVAKVRPDLVYALRGLRRREAAQAARVAAEREVMA